MNLEVLVSTMHQNDHNILEKMNIQSDAIIINQCNRDEIEKFTYKGNSIKFLSFSERGVGLSRNTALMRATADICLFADEDVTFVDNYKDLIINAFKERPECDMMIFNVPSKNNNRPTYNITKVSKVRWYNCLRYGAVRIAVKTEILKKKNIYFSLLFGGGAKYSAGEDSLFIADCIKKKMKVYTNPIVIGYVSQEDSTWFKGFTDKFFIDKGIFFAALSQRLARIFCLRYAIKHRRLFKNGKSWVEAYKLMIKGVNEYCN